MTVRSQSRKLTALLVAMSLSSAITTTTARAETPTCEKVLNACDAALNAKKRELDLADLGIKIRDEDRVRLQTENAQLRGQSGALWSNPAVWAAIGVIVGTFIGARATR